MRPLLHIPGEELKNLGVLDWGYTEESVPKSFSQYEQWINQGREANLSYLSDYRRDLRSDLKKVYPSFKSALVFLFGYHETKKWMLDNNRHEVAGYSLGFEGIDYHLALKHKLKIIAQKLDVESELDYFVSLDAQPVLERDLAYRAGLGWFGKNSMLINQKEGSYFIIGSLLLNQKLYLDTNPIDVDHCGQCNACVEACPTLAIDGDSRTLIARKCLSTFTIETYREAPAPEGFEKSRGEIFGCDICQDVCPWNRKPLVRAKAVLNLSPHLFFLKQWFYEMPKTKFKEMIEKESNRGLKKKLFGTPFDRPGKEGWLKNLKSLISSN